MADASFLGWAVEYTELLWRCPSGEQAMRRLFCVGESDTYSSIGADQPIVPEPSD